MFNVWISNFGFHHSVTHEQSAELNEKVTEMPTGIVQLVERGTLGHEVMASNLAAVPK